MKFTNAAAALAAVTVGVWLVACASDENASVPEGHDGESRVPATDASVSEDASDADATQVEECGPDTLCSFGPFDSSIPGGALDLRTRITQIRGRSATDVWAIGAHGAVAHFDGMSWSLSETGAVESFASIWLRDSSEVVAVTMEQFYGRGGELDGPDGGTPSTGGWLLANEPTLQDETAFALSPEFPNLRWPVTSTWAPVGAEWLWGTTLAGKKAYGIGATTNENNGLWRARIAPGTRTLEITGVLPPGACDLMGCLKMFAIHGSSADELWAVGDAGATFHITGAQGDTPVVTPFDSQTRAALNGVWVASATEAWSVGGVGTIRHYRGGAISWDVVDGVPTTENLRAVWGTSSSDVWAVGDNATVLHFDGVSWSPVKIADLGERRPDLFTVWSATPGHVWIGGQGVFLSVGGKP